MVKSKTSTPKRGRKAPVVEEVVESSSEEEEEEEVFEEESEESSSEAEEEEKEAEDDDAQEDDSEEEEGGYNAVAALKKKQNQMKSITPSKDDDLEYDLGNLTAIDSHPIDTKKLKSDKEGYLMECSRDNVQLLFNKVFNLPTRSMSSHEGGVGVLVQLPKGRAPVPREKHVPVNQNKTKWEEFAEAKGIEKRKRSRMIFDEMTDSWRPRHGYKRGNDEMEEWILPHKQNMKAEDPFLERKQAKRERIDSQGKRQKRNLDASKSQQQKTAPGRMTLPGVGGKPTKLDDVIEQAGKSTASLGNFNKLVKGEKKKDRSKVKGGRQHFDSNTSTGLGGERNQNMKVLDRIIRKGPAADVDKMARQEMNNVRSADANARNKGGRKNKKRKTY